MESIRNFKFTKKGVGIVAGALATGAAIILIPLAAQAREITDKDVNEYITNDVSFNDVLDAVSEYSEIDENLDALGYKKTLDDYTKARKARKTKEMNAALAEMGNMLLKASLCDYLGIDVNNNFCKTKRRAAQVRFFLRRKAFAKMQALGLLVNGVLPKKR